MNTGPDAGHEAVFFDLDGTLTDPALGITRCIQYALERLDAPVLAQAELLWCIGPPLLDSFEQLVGAQRAEQAVALYRERFADVGLFENEPYEGIEQTLSHLRDQGAALYVASSKPIVYVDRILAHFGLDQYFHQTFGAELDGTRSHKAELLSFALGTSGRNGERSIMVGDRHHDGAGAAANGMPFIGVLYGYGDQAELSEAGAAQLADHHSDIPALLLRAGLRLD